MQRQKTAELLKSQQFLFLLLEQIFTQVAYHLVNFSLILSVFKLTNSNFSVALLLLCFYLPSAIFVTIAGLTSDFVHRKKIIILSNLVWSTLVFTLSFLTKQFWTICLFAVLIQIADEFFFNAITSSIPNIVPKDQLLLANSLFNLTFYSSMVAGSFLVSLLSRFISPVAPLYFASGLTAFGAFFVSKIKIKQVVPSAPKRKILLQNIFQEITKGWQTIHENSTIKTLTLFLVVSNSLLSLAYAIAPGLLSVFGIDATDFSFVLILPLGIGMIAGNLILSKLGKKYRKIFFIQKGLIIIGAVLLILAFIPKSNHLNSLTHKRMNFEKKLGISLPLSLLFSFLGIGGVLTFIPATTAFQENLPEEVRGRTQSTNQLLTYITSTILAFFSGSISDLLGFFPLLLVLSILSLTSGFLSKKILIKAGVLQN